MRIAAWPREARDDTGGNGVAAVHHDDWNCRCRILGDEGPRCPIGHDDVDFETNQLGRQTRELIVLFLGPAELNGDVLALDVAQVAKAGPKCRDPPCPRGSKCGTEESNPSNLRRLLRVSNKRPCSR